MKYEQPKDVKMPSTYDGMGGDKTFNGHVANGLPVKKLETKPYKARGGGAATKGTGFSKNG